MGYVTQYPNILIVLEDDVGYEQWQRFGRGSNYPSTPQVNTWYDGGVRFTNFRCEQLCTPTRAALLTGMHGTDTGLGDLCRGPLQSDQSLDRFGLLAGFYNIANLLRTTHATACFGKAHLCLEFNGGADCMRSLGFDRYSGNLFNMQQFVEGYYDWDKDTDGVIRRENEYHTDVITREASEWVRSRGSQPWFCYLATYAAHIPLLSTGVPPSGTFNASWNTSTSNGVFKAAIESTDYYVARFWNSLPQAVRDNTIVIFATDNGSPGSQLALEVDPLTGTNYPSTVGKDSPYDFGIRVPLIVYGAGVVSPGRTVTALASVVDILPTILELVGLDVPRDAHFRGVSLAPYITGTSSAQVHDYTYSEQFVPNGAKTDADKTQNMWSVTSTDQFALVYRRDFGDPPSTLEFYDLAADPHQLTNLTPLGSVAGLSASQLARFNAMLAYRSVTLGFN